MTIAYTYLLIDNFDFTNKVIRMAPSENKVVIVTGASSGMGVALSKHFVEQGWNVAMADIQPNEALSKELGDKAAFFKTNVASYSSQAETFQAVWAKWGRIDSLCANAGIVDKSSIYLFDHRGKDEYVLNCFF